MILAAAAAVALAIAPVGGMSRLAVRRQSPGFPAGTRVMVLAPHADDESLATGQLIAAARRDGLPVSVVFLTNGDGFTRAAEETLADSGGLPDPSEYLELAQTRQVEARAAAAALGVPDGNLFFLGYPDRGLKEMLVEHWSAAAPYRSPYTGRSTSPYPDSHHQAAPYAGETLLEDLEELMATFHPTLLAIPHPDDLHSDHWATSVFGRLAVLRLVAQGRLTSPGPRLLDYVVHAGPWPWPPWPAPYLPLTAPQSLATSGTVWEFRPGDRLSRHQKELAIASYRTQLKVSRGYLGAFDRANELIGEVSPSAISSDGRPIQVANPWTGAAVGRRAGTADWSRATLTWDGKGLGVRLQLTSRPRRGSVYRIYLYSPLGTARGAEPGPARGAEPDEQPASAPGSPSRLVVEVAANGGFRAVLRDLERGTEETVPAEVGKGGRSVSLRVPFEERALPCYVGFEGASGAPETRPATWSLLVTRKASPS